MQTKPIRLTENKFHQLIRENVLKILNEYLEITSKPNTIYHSIQNINDIHRIKEEGLRPQKWKSLFWSNDTSFARRCTLLFSIETSQENIEKYKIVLGNPVSYSYGEIPYDVLKIEDCSLGKASDMEATMASVWIGEEIYKCDADSLKDFLNEYNFECIYEDVYEYFFGTNALTILKSTGIKTITLGI